VEPIKEFLKEFQPEIGKYRNEVTSFGAGHSLFNFIPGYWLFETDLNSLLDIYESPFGLKSRAELPLELRIPFDELAIISHLSLVFKDEISNRNYFIGSLFRGGKAQNENPYPAMRFNLFLSQHLRTAGNSVVPKFLNDHKDYDMLVITPSLNEIEIECKTQGNESGKRIDIVALEYMTVFLREAASSLGLRIKIHAFCDEGIRVKDVESLIPFLKVDLEEKIGKSLTHKVGDKTFQVLIESLGAPTDETTAEQMLGDLKPYMEERDRIGIISKTPFPNLKDFSFVAMKSAKNNRPLTNLVGHFSEASRQLTGKKPGILIVHHDADLNVQAVAELENFQRAVVLSFDKSPKISGFVYSSMDKLNPSGFGYPFGSLIAIPSLVAKHRITEVKIPGLFN